MPYTGPNLWTPQRKPSPAAVIDWNHPLAKGLIFFTMPGGVHRRDLVSGAMGTLVGGATLIGGGPFGPAITTQGGSQGIGWPFTAQVMNGLTNSHAFSIIVLANITGVNGNFDTLLGIPYYPNGASSSPWGLFFAEQSNTSAIAIAYPDTSGTQFKVSSANGYFQAGLGWLAYGVTRSGASIVFYRDGKVFGSTTITDHPIGFSSQSIGNTNGPTLLDGASSGTFATEGAQGQGALGAMWNRLLSPAEMLEMSRAPYQFLVEPMNPTRSMYLLGTIGGTTTSSRTVPASAALARQRAIPAAAALLATLTRTIPAAAALAKQRQIGVSAALQATLTRTIPATAALARQRQVPATAALLATLTRTIPGTAALAKQRKTPASAALLATLTHTIPMTAALARQRAMLAQAALLSTLHRTIQGQAALQATITRSVPAAAAIGSFSGQTRTIPVGASLYYLTIGYIAPSTPGIQVVSGPSATISIAPRPSATIQKS